MEDIVSKVSRIFNILFIFLWVFKVPMILLLLIWGIYVIFLMKFSDNKQSLVVYQVFFLIILVITLINFFQ